MRNHKTSKWSNSKSGATTRNTTGPWRRGSWKKKTGGNLGTRKGGGYSNTKRKDIQDTTSGHRTTN